MRTVFLGLLFLQFAVGTISGCRPLNSDEPVPNSTPSPAPQQTSPANPRPAKRVKPANGEAKADRQLSDLLQPAADGTVTLPDELVRPQFAAPIEIPAEQLAAFPIRKLSGKVLTLYTDLPSRPEIDELPQVFDLAVPQWCEYFHVKPEAVASWHVDGCLMRTKEPFQRVGLLPLTIGDFLHGFATEHQLWVLDQTEDYYRRHLVLHEGTHAFMKTFLGGTGPPWYAEGMAEMFGTHRWDGGILTMLTMPRRREDVPGFRRIELVRSDVAAGNELQLEIVMKYDSHAHLEVGPYAWSWAAAYFLDQHSQTRQAFREMRHLAPDRSEAFSRQFLQRVAVTWPRVVQDWREFIHQIDYGYDVERELVRYREVHDLPAAGERIVIDSARGWQSTGVRLEAGRSYAIEASGQFVLQSQPKKWVSEAGGITLHYHRGFPLGALIGAACAGDEQDLDLSSLAKPGLIGTGRTIQVTSDGVLFLRVNDWSRSLEDNEGQLAVRIVPDRSP